MSDPFPRSSGLLLHPTSLPGPYGIGDVGPSAHAWMDTLARARQTWWQVLPLGPTGFGDSPYQSFSTFAGNINLLSPDLLVQEGLLTREDMGGLAFPRDRVDYATVQPFKLRLLRHAWEHFKTGWAGHLREPYERFQFERRDWLGDYALFMAIKDVRRGGPWYDWPADLARRESMAAVRQGLADGIAVHQFGQFLFFRQWHSLREHARHSGVRLIGDVPIFVAPDSADVWANPGMYLLDESLRPRVVAGVPPDYFSRTGQLWGNPHYNWDAMRDTGYAWWVARLRATFELVDVVRIDHFRGFCAAWQVPAGEPTAVNGRWVPGPGLDFFTRVRTGLGGLPLIAEDLGEITLDVYALRDDLRLPGMKILQFALDGPKNPFLPHNHPTNCIVYTGTHDNDTTRGWWATAPEHERRFFRNYTARDSSDIAWDLLRMAWGSVANVAIAPVQDVLDLPTQHRMNLPGTGQGNWQWRMAEGALTDQILERLKVMTEVYARVPA